MSAVPQVVEDARGHRQPQQPSKHSTRLSSVGCLSSADLNPRPGRRTMLCRKTASQAELTGSFVCATAFDSVYVHGFTMTCTA